jgi:alcohol dehydrogenase (cytochrome c)
MIHKKQLSLLAAGVMLIAGQVAAVHATAQTRQPETRPVSDQDLQNANGNSAEWLMYGRDYSNQRFSPLAQITPDNIGGLRPAFAFSTGGKLGGLEATPLLRDGVLYFSADYARVFAVDARSGTMLWMFEPKYETGLDAELCCGPVNRGVAIKDDLLYVETLDARLIALDRKTGKVAWEQAMEDWHKGYTATGAPLVIGDHVIAGIAGGEYGARGALRAYDTKTGALQWTTYTVPAAGEPGSETWPGDTWKNGGGATWETGSYDPETKTLYWGTGNPGSWNSALREGDNKWTSSLLALDVDTGKIKWGFQYTPHDAWDYDGVNTPVLVDTTIDGKPAKLAVQSNRNGFLYILDRTNGKFIAALPTTEGINWTTGIDPETGRPKVNEAMVPQPGGPKISGIIPGLEGGTNWFPMAYNPDLNYVFLASNHWTMSLKAWKAEDTKYKAGDVYMAVDYQMARLDNTIGNLKAFDLAKRKFVWSVPSSLPLFSGILATKSGLLFTGDELGHFLAFDAKTGKELWRFQTGSGINASPMTYELDGVQYVAILSGLGGDPSFYYSSPKGGMLWVFALNGGKVEEGSHYSQQVIPEALPDTLPK